MNKLRKRFKKETGEDYLIEVNKSESNTEFNWQYVKWLEEQIVSKNESLHLVSSSYICDCKSDPCYTYDWEQCEDCKKKYES
tara:strand:+ start:169 stop:414 length:246 start_codon:yes stop_codon:yes gene_type:complete